MNSGYFFYVNFISINYCHIYFVAVSSYNKTNLTHETLLQKSKLVGCPDHGIRVLDNKSKISGTY